VHLDRMEEVGFFSIGYWNFSPPYFIEVRVTRSLVLCVCFVDNCLSFCLFLLAIMLSVFPRITDSD
jgi:hypothetical protein